MEGSGKSTLMKIMAGVDTEFDGERRLFGTRSLGVLEQEPRLNSDLDVEHNIMLGIGNKYPEIMEYLALKNAIEKKEDGDEIEDEDLDELSLEELQQKFDQVKATVDSKGDLKQIQRKVEIAINALRCPPSDSDVDHLSGV